MSRRTRTRRETWWLLSGVVLLCTAIVAAWIAVRNRDWLAAVIAVNNTGIALMGFFRLRQVRPPD